MQLYLKSGSAAETVSIGKKFSRLLLPGDLVLLSGELGGGKTTIISGIAGGLGLKENPSSPSFTILNEYNTGKRGIKFIHADFYRLENIEDLETTGLEDYIYSGRAIVCVEWGTRLKPIIKKDFLTINLEYLAGKESGINDRIITFKGSTEYWNRKLLLLKDILSRAGIVNSQFEL